MKKYKGFIFYSAVVFFAFFIVIAYGQEFTPGASPMVGAGQKSAPAAIGQKITLDIKGMDIVDVLKMLSQRAGMNIVIGKNVSGRVTLFLKDVDVNDAFELILLANELACEKKGDIINIMTQRDYELIYGERYLDKKQAKVIQLKYAKAADLSRALNQIKTNIGRVVVDEGSNTLAMIDTPDKIKEMEQFVQDTDLPLETRIFNLNYAQADKLQAKIQESITKGVGYLRIDERTNKIAITDYPKKLDEIANVIKAFDEKTQQVLIDAQIIEIKPSDKFYMGVDWDYFLEKNVRLIGHLPTGTGLDFLKIGLATTGATVSEKGEYKGILDILRTIGDTKILSSPRIVALNNQESKILVGTKEAYVKEDVITPSVGATQTTKTPEFVDVGIKLFVTPTINASGFITMKIRPEISSNEYKDFGTNTDPYKVPIVTTSQAETTVMVKDGVTIIIGGMQKEQRTKSINKIPILGDLPALGHLFSKTTDELTKTELVILLTPHTMTGESPYSSFSEMPPRDGAVAKMEKGNILIEKVRQASPGESLFAESMAFDVYKKNVLAKINKISSTYLRKGENLKGISQISFTISSDGRLKGLPRAISSINPDLDQIGIKSVNDAAPFAPFPGSLKKDEEIFSVTFSSG